MLENKLSENIKSNRIKNKLSQTHLAEKIYVSCQAVSKWERGLTVPELDKVCMLAKVFGITIDELVGAENSGEFYMIGIDGGGSKTEFMLFGSNFEICKRLTLGGCNPNAVGLEKSYKILSEGINSLIKIKRNVKAIYIGASGFKTGGNGNKIKKMLLKEFPSVKIDCGTDILNVIKASHVSGNLIAAICGTGTVVYSYKNKELIQYTGWGYLFDKGGSGYHIGRDGITAALEDYDNLGEKTNIRSIFEECEGKSIKEALRTFYEKGQDYVASFTSYVYKAYLKGDKKAEEILEKNAERTAFVINEAQKQNGINKVIISGSIFLGDGIYIGLTEKYLNKDIKLIKAELPQVYGASLICAEMCGIDTEKLYESFLKAEGLNA